MWFSQRPNTQCVSGRLDHKTDFLKNCWKQINYFPREGAWGLGVPLHGKFHGNNFIYFWNLPLAIRTIWWNCLRWKLGHFRNWKTPLSIWECINNSIDLQNVFSCTWLFQFIYFMFHFLSKVLRLPLPPSQTYHPPAIWQKVIYV